MLHLVAIVVHQGVSDLRQVLNRIFRLIVFDWDGTAVLDRNSPAPELVYGLEGLLQQGVVCAIVTGTKLEPVERQCTRYLSPRAKKNLFVCTNRGSEVYGFSAIGQPTALMRWTASNHENRALDDVARKLQEFLRNAQIHSEVIFDRLNRRKVDLIPVPEWTDPPKSTFSKLLLQVENRLKACGGMKNLIRISEGLVEQAGLTGAKITSDAKHIEIGLTDKSDSIRWISKNLLTNRNISPEQICLLGDEFGTIGALRGSDSLMQIPEIQGASVVSVGAEPEGVPPGVFLLKGGPQRFVDFLDNQLLLRGAGPEPIWQVQIPTPDPSWLLEQEGFDPSREREMETLFSLGNGYMGIRGSLDIPIPTSQADLYIAGVYAKKAVGTPYSELEFMTPTSRERPYVEIVPFPFPYRIRFWVNGNEFKVGTPSMSHFQRILDLKKGALFHFITFDDGLGKKILFRSRRCASLNDLHLLLQEIEIFCEDPSSQIQIDASIHAPQFNLNYPHLVQHDLEQDSDPAELILFETQAPSFRAGIANRVKSDNPLRVLRFLSVFTSRESHDVLANSRNHCLTQDWKDFDSKWVTQTKLWELFWKKSDIQYENNPSLTQSQRFNLYHLRIPTDHDPTVSVGSKALTGRAYEGHIFWDTEIFMLPFFVYTDPDIARTLLRYRYHTLGGARARARAMGYDGACYAWESTVTGEDVTPTRIAIKGTNIDIPIFTGTQQIHTSADIAYAIWRYWDATLDSDFLLDYGAEILIETARFWASKSIEWDGTFHIFCVVGPDEYHHSVGDNAFTNWMARFNLERATWVSGWMNNYAPVRWKELVLKLKLNSKEIEKWSRIATHLHIPKSNGIIEQFSGFFRLKDLTLKSEERLHAPILRLLHWQDINSTKVIKQADVLMIPFLFPDALTKREIEMNYRYYEPLTDHGSSLSPSVHAAIAAQIEAWPDAWKYWEQSLNFDLQNIMANTALGIHAACIGGTWQAFVFHILGIKFNAGEMVLPTDISPRLPPNCEGVSFHLAYRGKVHVINLKNSLRKVA